ncbi:unnamed protein product [Heligmosomoides polygyrus]|uniref:G protein-coupled receptor n=1 Tax=Heligmosomoides polygyrus TaxID=6339 RepID=A0A183GDL8_HELPZ|nr:unnamed protein product [Heligmosomoides polygyrus]
MTDTATAIHSAGFAAELVSVAAAIISALLLLIYMRCPLKRVHEYRYFFLMTAIQDAILALCCLALTPVTPAPASTVATVASAAAILPSQELKRAADEARSTSTIPVAEARSKDCRGLRGRSRGVGVLQDDPTPACQGHKN